MLKTKFKLSILLIILLICTCTLTLATDTTNGEAVVTSETANENVEAITEGEEETTTTEEESIEYTDKYLVGTDIVIDTLIDGNVYAIGDNVKLTGQIGGDLFVLAENLDIDGGAVYGNVFAAANTIRLNGQIYDLYSVCDKLTVEYDGFVYRDLRTASSEVILNGVVRRNANISTGSLELQSDCIINGNLNYSSDEEIEIPEGIVQGEVNFEKEIIKGKSIISYVLEVVSLLIYVLAIWFVICKFAKKLNEKLSNKSIKDLLISLGIGVAAIILIPVASIALLCTVVGATLGFTLLAICSIVVSLSIPVAIITIANLIKEKINKGKSIIYVILTTIAVWALSLIPFAGGVISFIVTLVGFGLLITSLFKKSEKVVNE